MTARVFVLASTKAHAADWCRREGIAPHARTTVLLSRPEDARGHSLHPGDRLVLLDPSHALTDAMRPALHRADAGKVWPLHSEVQVVIP